MFSPESENAYVPLRVAAEHDCSREGLAAGGALLCGTVTCGAVFCGTAFCKAVLCMAIGPSKTARTTPALEPMTRRLLFVIAAPSRKAAEWRAGLSASPRGRERKLVCAGIRRTLVGRRRAGVGLADATE